MSQTNRTLFHGTSIDGSPLFARPETIEQVSACHLAVRGSRTWGDFRRLLPTEDFAKVVEAITDGRDYYGLPEDAAEFDRAMVPGLVDGDWPAWIKQTMLSELPEEVQSLGSAEASTLNGPFLEFDPDSLTGILDDLKNLGWTVIDRPDLVWEPD
jgi:hypothetical protein